MCQLGDRHPRRGAAPLIAPVNPDHLENTPRRPGQALPPGTAQLTNPGPRDTLPCLPPRRRTAQPSDAPRTRRPDPADDRRPTAGARHTPGAHAGVCADHAVLVAVVEPEQLAVVAPVLLPATLGATRQTLLLDVKEALVDEFVDAEGA